MVTLVVEDIYKLIVKMSYQYSNSHYQDKTVSRPTPSFLHKEIPIHEKMIVYLNEALKPC